ncbi:hypothetical protein GCM10022251_72010 [Phytohabitans flavus]|uniref:hypothetical protein n=1 Tax=Phytohabitans flavus TaxID=1076124 RepID=UPI0031E6D1E7
MTQVYDEAASQEAPPAEVERLRAVVRVLPPAAVLTHHTAAMLYGFGVVPTDTLHITLPAGTTLPQRRGIAAHGAVLPFADVRDVLGLRCLGPARCAVDLARQLGRLDALAVLDAALRVGACTPDDLADEVARHDGLRGVRQARELVRLADPRARCRQESHLRLILHDGLLPAPEPQLVVLDGRGRVRCRIDLGYAEERVGVVYDGDSRLDQPRHNWLETRGWRLLYFNDDDLYGEPDELVQTVRAALYHPR